MALTKRFNVSFSLQFEDALEELPISKENGYTKSCDSKPIPIANPDAFEFLLPMILGIVRIYVYNKIPSGHYI